MSKKDSAKSSVKTIKKVAKKVPTAPARVRPGSRNAGSGTASAKASAKADSKAKSGSRVAVAKKPAPSPPPATTPRPRPTAAQASPPAASSPPTTAAPATLPPEIELARIDEQLVGLLNRRVALYLEKMKGSHPASRISLGDLDQQQVWNAVDRVNQGPLTPTELRSILRPLLSAGRQRVKQVRVAYLGPPYSFTHQAAISRFGESADLVPVSTIATVFEEVNRGHVDFGIVPIENSTDGRIVDTLDMFTRLPLRICGEVLVHVHHNLLARCDRSEITEIYSKPQALSQCRDWLSRNMPQARLIEVTSTSTAAQLARDKPNVAAVASRQAAIQYDVPIVAECIEDNQNNVTRFAVIGEAVAEQTGSDRTAVLLQIPHKPGSLSEALEPFRRNKVNLTWIESFPLRQPAVGYLFFLDFEGHVSEPRIKKTIRELEALPPDRLEILGSYPRSEPSR